MDIELYYIRIITLRWWRHHVAAGCCVISCPLRKMRGYKELFRVRRR